MKVNVFWQPNPGKLPVFYGQFQPWRLPDKDGNVSVRRHNHEFAVDPKQLRYADTGVKVVQQVTVDLTPSAAVGLVPA